MIKNYADWLNENESVNEAMNNPLMDSILSSLENTIQGMLSAIEKYFLEKEMSFTAYDRELARLNLIFDMLKSIESYTLPTDTLVSINPRTSGKGNIEISARIQRDDTTYYLETEAILAGGYNIQTLHYRYITKTDLPKTGRNEISQSYAAEIKKMSKLEKLNNDLKRLEEKIKQNEEKAAFAKTLSDEEVLKRYRSGENPSRIKVPEDPTWEEIVKRGADANYDHDRSKYEKQREEYRKSNIDFWRSQNIKWPEQDIASALKEIAKLKKKIEAAIQQNQ